MQKWGAILRPWVLVFPAVAWTLAFFVAPLLVMTAYSFWRRIDGQLVTDWTLENYDLFIGRPYLFQALFNSLEITLLTTVVSIVLAYPFAYILAYRVPSSWQRVALLVAVLPFWTSYVVRSYSWLLVLSETGVVNETLIALGILDTPIRLAHSRVATIIGFTHFFTMMLILTIYANLVQIPASYRAAAADLGASRLQIFFRITLPLSVPGLMIGTFLTFVLAIGDYATPQILGGYTDLVLPQAIILQVQRRADFPMAAAMSLVLMVVVLVVYAASSRWLRMARV